MYFRVLKIQIFDLRIFVLCLYLLIPLCTHLIPAKQLYVLTLCGRSGITEEGLQHSMDQKTTSSWLSGLAVLRALQPAPHGGNLHDCPNFRPWPAMCSWDLPPSSPDFSPPRLFFLEPPEFLNLNLFLWLVVTLRLYGRRG